MNETKESPVTTVVLAVGLNSEQVPTIAAVAIGTNATFEHTGLTWNYSARKALVSKFNAWKENLNSPIEMAELDRGIAAVFFSQVLGLSVEMGATQIDIRTFYRAVVNEPLVEDVELFPANNPTACALRLASLYERLIRTRASMKDVLAGANEINELVKRFGEVS